MNRALSLQNAFGACNAALQNVAHGGHATPEECPVCGTTTCALDYHLTTHKPYREPWWLRLLRRLMRPS